MRYLIVGVLCALLWSVASGQERIELTTPVVKTVASYEVVELSLRWKPDCEIMLNLKGSDDSARSERIAGQEACDLLSGWSKNDIAGKSIQRRVFEYLITQGKLSGTVMP